MQQLIDSFAPPPVPVQQTGEQLPAFLKRLRDEEALFQSLVVQKLRDIINQLNTGVQGVGSSIASAPQISPTAYQHLITGTGTITQINVPPRYSGGPLILRSQDGFSLGSGGNISIPYGDTAYIAAGGSVTLNYNPNTNLWQADSLAGLQSNGGGRLAQTNGTTVDQALLSNGPGQDPSFSQTTYPRNPTGPAVLHVGLNNNVQVLGSPEAPFGSFLRAQGIEGPVAWSETGISDTTKMGDLIVNVGGHDLGSLPDVAKGAVLVSGGVLQVPFWSTNPPIDSPVGVKYNIPYGPVVQPDLGQGSLQIIVATAAFGITVNLPLNAPAVGTTGYSLWYLLIQNSTGGAMGTIAFPGYLTPASIPSPAGGGTRFYQFLWDGTTHWMMFMSANDVV